MGKKLYVGNLPYSATDAILAEVFGQAGTVESAKVITDRDTGRSKGFGFVEMASDAEAQTAISQFNGADFEGRTLTVNEARPMEPRAPRSFGGEDRRGGGGFGGGFGGGGGGGRGGRGGDRGGFGGGGRRNSRFDD
jgi:RNA recognition motif-containing protein